MPINLQPAFDALPAYRPVKFEVFATAPDPTVIENAVVTILNGGVAIGPPVRYKSSRNEPSIFPLSTDYFFEIDIQKYIQDILAPTAELPSTFPPDNILGSVTNVDMFGLFSISVTYEFISTTTGLLEPLAIPAEVSNQFYVYSNSRKHQEQMDLTDFIGVPLGPDTLMLTKSARVLEVCEDDEAYLSVIQPNIFFPLNGFRIELFDANGVSLDFGLGATNNPPLSNMQTMNVGFDSLSNQTYVDGAPNWANPLIASYTISFGYLFLFPGPTYFYIEQTEVFTYEIVGKCCGLRDLRLHWMNLLGGTDSYTFNSEKALNLSATSSQAEKALGWEIGSATPHDVNDVGKFKFKSEGSTQYIVKSRFLTNDEALWLSELLTSPKVYAQLDGELIPVIVEPTQQVITRHQGKIQYEIEVSLANDLIIQRI